MNYCNISASKTSSEFSEITIMGLGKAEVRIKAVSKAHLFLKWKIWITEKIFGKKFVLLHVNQQPFLLKIKDVSERLGISRKEIIASEKEGSINSLMKLAFEAKSYHVKLSMLSKYRKPENLEKLHYLEYLADSFNLPLFELLEAEEAGNFEEYMKKIMDVEKRSDTAFKKLDQIYKEVDGRLITKSEDGNLKTMMSLEELNSIKKVIKAAYKILVMSPKSFSVEVEQIIRISENYSILAKSSEKEFRVIGLFGKLLGCGNLGIVVHTVDLLEGQWTKGEYAALKIPQILDENSSQIIREETLIKKIHKDQLVLGIQNPSCV